jgi:hypothetical protein
MEPTTIEDLHVTVEELQVMLNAAQAEATDLRRALVSCISLLADVEKAVNGFPDTVALVRLTLDKYPDHARTRFITQDTSPPLPGAGGPIGIHQWQRGSGVYENEAGVGNRVSGWIGLDHWGNEQAFVADGTFWPPEDSK